MRNLTAAFLLLLISPTAAQTPPKPVKTLRVEAIRIPLYTIDAAGRVTIDWQRVEAAAHGSDLTDRDIARALIAVRDGTARPER